MKQKSGSLNLLRLSPEHNPYARYYLGFLCFDSGDFEEAKNIIREIPSDVFKKNDQGWRDVNIRSLKACTNALLGFPQFDELNAVCEIFKNDNDCEFDLPIYLVNTCLELWQNEEMVNEGLYYFTRNIIEMLKNPDYEDAFSNEHKKLKGLLDPDSVI